MNKSMLKALYEGKFFYEVIQTGKPMERLVIGPLEGIRYTVKSSGPMDMGGIIMSDETEYDFVQVINGQPKMAFTKDQILVTDKPL